MRWWIILGFCSSAPLLSAQIVPGQVVAASSSILDQNGAILPGSNVAAPNFGCVYVPGCVVQILSAGNNNIAHVPNADGSPSGGDSLLATIAIGQGIWPCDTLTGMFDTSFQPHPADGTKIFARVWNASSIATATHFGDSGLFTVSGAAVFDVSALGLTATTLPKGLAVLAGWNTSTLSAYGPSPFAATTAAANISVGGLTRGAGVDTGGTPVTRGWGAQGWNQSSSANAISGNDFATFTVTPNAGYTVSFHSISKFDYRRASTGPASGLLQYRVGASGAFSDITTVSYSSTSTAGASIAVPINLSGISALQNIPGGTVVTFRIVNYSGTGGQWYLYDVANNTAHDFEVQGTVFACSSLGTPAPSSDGPKCVGETLHLFANTTAASYNWTGPNGFSSSEQNPSIANVTTANAGVYSLTVSQSGCTSAAGTTSVAVNTVPSATLTAAGSVCANSTGNFASVTDGGEGAAYNWTISGGSITGGAGTPAITYTAGASGSVALGCTVSVNGCASTGTANVSITAVGAAGAVSGPSSSCQNAQGVSYSIAAVSGATSYDWTLPAGASIASGNGSASIAVNFDSASGAITVTPRNGVCAGASSSLNVTLLPAPTVTAGTDAPFYNGAYRLLQGQTLHLTASAVPGATAYSWKRNTTTLANTQNTSDTPPAGAHTYNVTVTAPCGPATDSLVVIVSADTEGQGVPDDWKTAHDYPADANSSTTMGGNGLTLRQSYLMGVDPDDPNATLVISEAAASPTGEFTLTWRSKQDGTTPVRNYDVYAQTGEFSGLSGAARIGADIAPTGDATSFTDTGASAAAMKFYRVTIAGTTEALTPQVAGVQQLNLTNGFNYISMAMLPGTNTLAGVLGTSLPSGSSLSAATEVDIFDQTTQTYSATYFLHPTGGWLRKDTFTPSNNLLLDPNKGLTVTIRPGVPAGSAVLRTTGFVPTSSAVQTVQNNGYTLAASRFPKSVSLADSGLVGSGFTGGRSLAQSDNLLFWNPVTQQFDVRVWFNTNDSNWYNADGSLATKQLKPGEAFLIQRKLRAGNFNWTNPVPYAVPLQGP